MWTGLMQPMSQGMMIVFLVIAGYVLLINLITFGVFGVDKRKARLQRYRVPEKTLFLLAAVGGSVGALVGMQVFHHKTRKVAFRIGMPLILIVQVVAVVFLLYYCIA